MNNINQATNAINLSNLFRHTQTFVRNHPLLCTFIAIAGIAGAAVYYKPNVNRELQLAAKNNDSAACRYLITQLKANPNATDAKGRTAVQTAISNNAWLSCKALIDNQAHLTREDTQQITQYLTSQGVPPMDCESFMKPFPNPYEFGGFFRGKISTIIRSRASHTLE